MADRWIMLTTALGLLAWPIWGLSSMLAAFSVPIGVFLMATTPLTLLGYLDMSARSNVLVKDGRSLDLLDRIDTVVFDKTGTLTLERPHVGQLYPLNGVDAIALLTYAAAAEQRQSHPIARAICQAAEAEGIALPTIADGAYQIGYGIQVTLQGKIIRVGSHRFMEMEGIALSPEIEAIAENGHSQGYSMVYVAIDEMLG